MFPIELIGQEVSQDRYITIPDEIRDIYRLYRPTPLYRARSLEKALDTPAKIYYKYEGVSPTGSHKPNTAIAQAFYNKKEGIEKLSGPRIGVTTMTNGSISKSIESHFITQYGWQFETSFADGDDFSGLVEVVALAGGMEQGMLLPSLSSLVGIRQEKGFEFAFGPNISMSGLGMVAAVGHCYQSGSFNVPVNLSWVMSNDALGKESGHRISLTVGFTLNEKNKY